MTYSLFPKEGKFYKANLHAHTDISDGHWTKEELKAGFMEHGYQIVAYTDHEYMEDHSELNEKEKFLAITAYEMGISAPNDGVHSWVYDKVYHFNLLAKDPKQNKHIYFDPSALWCIDPEKVKNAQYVGSIHPRQYHIREINNIIRCANENGFLVIYNHPVWSMQDYTDYAGLEGLWGVEIINGATCTEGYEESQPHVFEEMLRMGKKVFPVAADDCHGPEGAYIGFTMVKAPELTYDAVMNAFEKGNFYASDGPTIESAEIKDGILHIQTSPVVQIMVPTDSRIAMVKNAPDADHPVTEADFDLHAWKDTESPYGDETKYIRISLVSANGRHAYSRAYFQNEILPGFDR